MADSYRMLELDGDDVQRLLPREILEDIGVIIDDPAERLGLDDVVDDLAARLASVLGGAPVTKTPCRHSPPQLNARRGSLAGGKGTVRWVAVTVPPPFLPSSPPAVPWQMTEGLMRRNSMVIYPTPTATMPLAGAARPPTSTIVRRGTGTGVFFPRAEVARRTTKAARSPPLGNGGHACAIHQRGQPQVAVATVKTQQEMGAVAAHMERRHYLGVHVLPRQELALPLQWTY